MHSEPPSGTRSEKTAFRDIPGRRTNIPLAVRHLVEQYRRFLRTSYRFLDEGLRTQFEAHLAEIDVVVKGPYVTLAREFESGRTLAELVAAGAIDAEAAQLRWPFGANPLYRHQERALELGRQGNSFVVTTGTGSGKTESFLLPVVDGILRRKREGVRGVQAVLVYPMNALANDQLERLRRLIRGRGVDLSYALYTGDSDATALRLREEPAETERLTRDAVRSKPPDLLLTNYKQLEFLLVRRADRDLFGPALRYLVLDELHSYRGALATEIACLLRRVKVRAGARPGELVAIGTSATVASAAGGQAALAAFASTLFGERVPEDAVVREVRRPAPEISAPAPPVPTLTVAELESLDPNHEEEVLTLAERLCGRMAPAAGSLPRRVGALLRENGVAQVLERTFAEPRSIADAVAALQQRFPDRVAVDPEALRREIEAYLLIGSIGDEGDPPHLRPKLHTFFHGIYDVALCLDPGCRALVPQGGSECPRCGSVARPAALCRTCGQDFVKVVLPAEPTAPTEGTADFFSSEHTAFLTPKLHELPATESAGDEEDEPTTTTAKPRRTSAGKKPELARVCSRCGRLFQGKPAATECPACNRATHETLLLRGKLNTCPTCGDVYTRGDIVTPLRTGTASTVSVLATHHLDDFEREDRKLLVFADNRQDVAHQAGYSADRHRAIALRHGVLAEVQAAEEEGKDPIPLEDLPQRLLDRFRGIELIDRRKLTEAQRRRWLDALTMLAAGEFTRAMRQRAALETLGLIGVDYEFLDELAENADFEALARRYDLQPQLARNLVRAILDVFRRNRAVSFDFLQEYTDPNRNRRYRELEAEPYNLRFGDHDQAPRAFALDRPPALRARGVVQGILQENEKAGNLTAIHKLANKKLGDRKRAADFLRELLPLLLHSDHPLLVEVRHFPIPKKEWPEKLKLLQLDRRVIRLSSATEGFRCNACRTWRPYPLPFCPNPRCKEGEPQKVAVDNDNYYVRLYRDRTPQRFLVMEHSAQIDGEERANRERDFKEGRLEALVCTPTLELGVDIGPLLSVVLRNAPPTPANYAQRVGRAGRRLQIGFASTFCTGGAHDRHAFVEPDWLIAGEFAPPRIRLDNPKVVERHLRSLVLENLENELPARLGDLLDNKEAPSGWRRGDLDSLVHEVASERESLVRRLVELFEEDRREGREVAFGEVDSRRVVDTFDSRLSAAFEEWWQRVRQLDREFHEFSKIGSPRQDERKAKARKRAFFEITADPQRAYTLNYLAERGLLPAYQFPIDTFSLDPGVDDTPTLHRPAAIAIEEFAPGNFVYANGHKLRSIRVLFPGGPGAPGAGGRTDAESSGRLEDYHFCRHCDEAIEAPKNNCPRCGNPLPAAESLLFVNAFEAEENLRIGADEESRQRERQLKRETLLAADDSDATLYGYPLAPALHVRLAKMLVTNWGRTDRKREDGHRFALCPDCGRHCPYDSPSGPKPDPALEKKRQDWLAYHAKFCSGQLTPMVLAYRFRTDALVLAVPGEDPAAGERTQASPVAITLAEALRLGASEVLELESDELSSFVRSRVESSPGEEIVLFETTPGGSGYTGEIARRLPEVAAAARKVLYNHVCSRACYLCLKHYRNQWIHAHLDKNVVRTALLALEGLDAVEGRKVETRALQETLSAMLGARAEEARTGGAIDQKSGRYRKGFIEEPLLAAMRAFEDLPEPSRELEIRNDDGLLVTVPDFAWSDSKVAVYCDGYAYHGDAATLELDARKRNYLQLNGWAVLVFWGRTILKDPGKCAAEIRQVYRTRLG